MLLDLRRGDLWCVFQPKCCDDYLEVMENSLLDLLCAPTRAGTFLHSAL